jgi:hypothetical protein
VLHLAASRCSLLLQVRCSALSITTSTKAEERRCTPGCSPVKRSYQRPLARLSAHHLGHLRAFLDTAPLYPYPPCQIGASVPSDPPLTALTPRRPLKRPILAPHRTVWEKRLDRSLPVSHTFGPLTAITKTDPWFQQNSPTAWWPLFRRALVLRRDGIKSRAGTTARSLQIPTIPTKSLQATIPSFLCCHHIPYPFFFTSLSLSYVCSNHNTYPPLAPIPHLIRQSSLLSLPPPHITTSLFSVCRLSR